MLSETWLRNEELVELEDFKRITQNRPPGINREGGVAIYQNVRESQHEFNGNHDDFVRRNTQTKSNLGHICDTTCTLPNGKPIVVTAYISVNQNVTDIIDYINETLLAYTEGD
ncbi:hypothetical protein TNIN_364321 [Trichonephila inaurata madagascariensis]|uniref:Uncharacterized protein n=1 Tax=Trichonephila inaurata madagascariensis TaxID=2747483 RepID=A0A8X6YCJ9_9ARAC|nr:hypothetical protein TNIN_364321 [Trichonephila inaurata madagascariensis]